MKRCVVIHTPDFDEPGKAGIEAAQQMAEDIRAALAKVPAELAQAKVDPGLVTETRAYLSRLKYLVRKVEF